MTTNNLLGSVLRRWMAPAIPVIVFGLAGSSPVAAQQPPAAQETTTFNATVAGLGCTTTKGANQFAVASFSMGASNPVTIGPGGPLAGKVSISSLNIQKSLDACSPALFGAAVKGTPFATLTLVQLDKKNTTLMTVTLSQVIVESIQWSGSESGAATLESISFAFSKSCIQDGPSGNKVCYDIATARTF